MAKEKTKEAFDVFSNDLRKYYKDNNIETMDTSTNDVWFYTPSTLETKENRKLNKELFGNVKK